MERDTRGESNGWKSGLITGGAHACHRGHPRVKRESRRHLNSLISGRELWSRVNRGAHSIITQLLIFYCLRAAGLSSPQTYLLYLTSNNMSVIVVLTLDKIIMNFIMSTSALHVSLLKLYWQVECAWLSMLNNSPLILVPNNMVISAFSVILFKIQAYVAKKNISSKCIFKQPSIEKDAQIVIIASK